MWTDRFRLCEQAEEEERRAIAAEEALEAEEHARAAKRPRHQDLVLATLVEDAEPEHLSSLSEALNVAAQGKRIGIIESKQESQEAKELKELRDKFQGLKVVSRAKVTQDRVYSAAYHPEITKDLIFFGGEIVVYPYSWAVTKRLQINMASWVYGMLAQPLMKSPTKMEISAPQWTSKNAGNIGASRPTGQPLQNHQFQPSNSTR